MFFNTNLLVFILVRYIFKGRTSSHQMVFSVSGFVLNIPRTCLYKNEYDIIKFTLLLKQIFYELTKYVKHVSINAYGHHAMTEALI